MARITKCYNWRNKLNQDGKAPIDIRISKGKARKYVATGYLIEPRHWDANKCEVKKTHPHYATINARLNQIVYQYEQKEIELINSGKAYTLEDFFERDTAKLTFADFCEKIITERRSGVSDKHKSLFRLVVGEVVALKKTNNFAIRDLDLDFLYRYQNTLRDRDLNNKTNNKRLQTLAMFVNEAIKSGILKPSQNCFLDFKYLKEVDTERAIPSAEDVAKLEHLDLSYNPELRQVRDMFVFNCYVGLRNADLFDLKNENVSIESGEVIIHLIEHKTKKPQCRNVSVLGYGKGVAILHIYKGVDADGYLFPRLPDKKIRDGVVMLRTIIKARQPFTFYGSRHYCLSDLASRNIPSNEVQAFANHSDLRTTEQYYHSLSLDRHLRESFNKDCPISFA